MCCHTSEIERNTTGKRAPAEGNLFIYRQTCVRAGIRREYGKSRKTRSSRSSNGTKTECDEGKEKERKRETDDGEEENGKPRQERKREREGESGNANRGRGDRDFWARALHLLACSGTRHTHRLLPATPVVTHAAASSLSPLLLSSLHPSGPVYLLLSLSPSRVSSWPYRGGRRRRCRSLPSRGNPPPVFLSRVPRPRRDRDARESIARGLRQGEHPGSLHSPLLFPCSLISSAVESRLFMVSSV